VVGIGIADVVDAVKGAKRTALVAPSGHGFVVFVLDDAHVRLPYYLCTCRSPVARSTNTSVLTVDLRRPVQDSAASIAVAVCSPIDGTKWL
jgi:hypothetical protein